MIHYELQPIADRVEQHLEIISKNFQFSTRRTKILMGFIMYYFVLIVNPMGRILVRWKRFRNNLEMLWHPISNGLYSVSCKITIELTFEDVYQVGCHRSVLSCSSPAFYNTSMSAVERRPGQSPSANSSQAFSSSWATASTRAQQAFQLVRMYPPPHPPPPMHANSAGDSSGGISL